MEAVGDVEIEREDIEPQCLLEKSPGSALECGVRGSESIEWNTSCVKPVSSDMPSWLHMMVLVLVAGFDS